MMAATIFEVRRSRGVTLFILVVGCAVLAFIGMAAWTAGQPIFGGVAFAACVVNAGRQGFALLRSEPRVTIRQTGIQDHQVGADEIPWSDIDCIGVDGRALVLFMTDDTAVVVGFSMLGPGPRDALAFIRDSVESPVYIHEGPLQSSRRRRDDFGGEF